MKKHKAHKAKRHGKSGKGFQIGKYKNWLILGGAVVAGYLVYHKASSAIAATPLEPPLAKPLVPPTQAQVSAAAVPPPDLNGPAVKKGVAVSSRSTTCVDKKEPGMIYARVTLTDQVGYNYFKSPKNGTFTRRFLCVDGKKWAEVKPA